MAILVNRPEILVQNFSFSQPLAALGKIKLNSTLGFGEDVTESSDGQMTHDRGLSSIKSPGVFDGILERHQNFVKLMLMTAS